ncbi:MAG: ribosome small subunit-dependent GTPase A [Anaerolineae bacterium]|nr:ribosome small subunit-dependent GTPase A [Anaerolineae bacterium]
MSKRKKIKSNRKPKIVRDKSWKTHVSEGNPNADLEMPRVERILPRGKEEEKVKRWTKIEDELTLEDIPQIEDLPCPDGWYKGTVIRVSTGLYDVDLGDQVAICSIRGALTASDTGYTNIIAVGDRVWVSDQGILGQVIERVLPRQTVLARPDVQNPDLSQIIVANVNQLLIVSSWLEPDPWMEFIDRSLITASEGNMESLICLNKVDLAENLDECREEMHIYHDLGYRILFTSAETGQGIDALRTRLVGHSTAVVGLSGVGKSSLLMAVQPDLELRVDEVSEYSGQGRHTTTQVSLLKLKGGGYVVDTPGLRELGLIKVHRYELVLHFPEILALADRCRFTNCTHLVEPGCAVIQAVEEERIPWSRYASYEAIYNSLPEYYTEA